MIRRALIPATLAAAAVGLTATAAPADPAQMTKTEWSQVAIGDKRIDTVRAICGCTEQGTPYHRTWHGNDYRAYEYLTPVGNAFVFFRVGADGSSRAGFQKDWCPGSPLVDIPTGDCQSAWN